MQEIDKIVEHTIQKEIEAKLELISDIWNHYIWEYKTCNSKVKFSDDIRTNYLGDILGYFRDTFDIIFKQKFPENYTDGFSYNISLLQAIYVQQDFVEEMLIVFKCKVNKGELKKDLNYNLNREIRNELIGHPIRKQDGKLVSSTTFGYNHDTRNLVYLRYHRDNGFQFQPMSYLIADIISRHGIFLTTYFDLIIKNLKKILNQFSKEVIELQDLIESQSFEKVISLVSLKYESFFKNTLGYGKEMILKVYQLKDKNKRYSFLIDRFIRDLKISLKENLNNISEMFRTEIGKDQQDKITINYVNTDDTNEKVHNCTHQRDFHYEMGKLGTCKNHMDFDYFSGTLRREFDGNSEVINELNHMQLHLDDHLEYYSSYYMLRHLIMAE